MQRGSAEATELSGKQGFEAKHLDPETVLLESSRLGCSQGLNLGASSGEHLVTAQPALNPPGAAAFLLQRAVLA